MPPKRERGVSPAGSKMGAEGSARGSARGSRSRLIQDAQYTDLSRLKSTVLTTSLLCFCQGYNCAIIAGALNHIELDPCFSEIAASDLSVMRGMLVSCVLAGAAFGAAFACFADYTGRRPALLLVSIIFNIGPAAMAFSTTLWLLVAIRTLVGVAVGISSVLVNLYISEIAPASIRGQLGGWAPFLNTCGSLASFVISAIMGEVAGDGAWRAQLGAASLPAAVQLVLQAWYIPETPRWLLSRSHRDKAGASLKRLFPQATVEAVEHELQRIDLDLSWQNAKIPLCDLCGKHGRASLLGVTINVLQQVSGINVLIFFGPTILRKAGFLNTWALVTTALVSCMQLVATGILMKQVDKIGRRPLALIGIAAMMAGLAMLVVASAFARGTGRFGWRSCLSVAGMFVFRCAFSLSMGPLPYIMTSEFFPQEARATGAALSWTANFASNFCVSLSFPIVVGRLSQSFGEENGTALIFCIYIVFCGIAYVWVRGMLPETRGLRLEAAAGASACGSFSDMFWSTSQHWSPGGEHTNNTSFSATWLEDNIHLQCTAPDSRGSRGELGGTSHTEMPGVTQSAKSSRSEEHQVAKLVAPRIA